MSGDPRVNQLKEMSIKLDQMTNTLAKLTEEARPNKAAALKRVEDSAPDLVDTVLRFLGTELKGQPQAAKAAVLIALQNWCGTNEFIVKDCVNQILEVNRDTSKLDKVRRHRRILLNAYNSFREYLEEDGADLTTVKAPDTMPKGGNFGQSTTTQRKARF